MLVKVLCDTLLTADLSGIGVDVLLICALMILLVALEGCMSCFVRLWCACGETDAIP